MKNIKIIVILIITIIFATNCTKQNNCDCGLVGKFVYYEEPLHAEKDFGLDIRHGNPDIDAVLILLDNENNEIKEFIQGYVPRKFRTNDTINVKCCTERINKKGVELTDLHFCPLKIKCIERIE